MDERLSGIVRTSTNLGVAYIEDDEAVLVSAPRASRQTDLDALHARYASFARLGGGRAIVTSEYRPGSRTSRARSSRWSTPHISRCTDEYRT
jgi:hypothetical protein